MNHYTLSDIKVGMKESFSVKITQEQQDMFTKLSANVNQMHLSKDICVKMLQRILMA